MITEHQSVLSSGFLTIVPLLRQKTYYILDAFRKTSKEICGGIHDDNAL